MKIYTISSKKYGDIKVLLDDEDYNNIIKEDIILHPKYDKTINNFYIQLHIEDKSKKDNRTTVGLHRYLTKYPKGKVVDHINRNPLDNRRCNLRVCSTLENANNKGFYKNNKSGYKGVYYINLFDCWMAELRRNKKCYRSKRCNSMEEAIMERKILEQKYLKEVM